MRKLEVKKPSKLFLIITALWVYSLVFYGLEAFAFLNFRGWVIVFGLGVPLFFACFLPVEYLIRRLD